MPLFAVKNILPNPFRNMDRYPVQKEKIAALRGAKVIELRNLRRGKFFAILADVILEGESLAPKLIAKGLGVPYYGR